MEQNGGKWLNRIVSHGELDPHKIRINPENPYKHSQFQLDSVNGSLSKLGMSDICARFNKPHTEKSAIDLGYKLLEFIPKYKYFYPIDDAMRKQIEPLRKPYPKRATGEGETRHASSMEIGGAIPTVALNIYKKIIACTV